MTDYPQWVRERACELANSSSGVSQVFWDVGRIDDYARDMPGSMAALLAHVLKYETAPVDPAVEALRAAMVMAPSHPKTPEELVDALRVTGFDIVKLQP